MAESKEKRIVLKLKELTDSGRLKWAENGQNSYVAILDQMTPILSWDPILHQHTLDIHDVDVSIRESDLDYGGLLDDLYNSILASMPPVASRHDPQQDLQYVLDALNRV